MTDSELRQRTSTTGSTTPDVKKEVLEGLRTIFDPATCTRKGLCPVTKIRRQQEPLESHSLYFEQHGSGPEKVVFIMGLNSTSFSWAMQVNHFGRSPNHTILVFDNRGVGNSGRPRGPYSTSGMAEDVIVLLDYVGWTETRDLHVVGISLGGMIAQELSTRIPERIISLTLAVTTPGGLPWYNFPPWKGVASLGRLFLIADAENKLPILLDMVFPQEWLAQKAEDDPEGRTNREIQTGLYRHRLLMTRPQHPLGGLSQMYAGLLHHVDGSRLRKISSSIPKVLIVTGDKDHLVKPMNSRYLKQDMPEAELVVWEDTGHALHLQWVDRFNELLERVFREGKQRLADADGVWTS
ncbi:Esterase/lipase/thioesterase [Heterobasidion irregulare TC 32-1]|uniref:Esterase/lipase/thioesterase n=1 Tax=Heterobasidion irregulare (strain TC 32-1) TaxID=747525 RepID=W4JWI7_HETIT|nr:Esterase/lipase/thioesterase [Heterobasidion irregulare TC 32-1]ETW77912.1 Esterase/lipase/thioesterase [Heterobasidion irregulare TC 32-1]